MQIVASWCLTSRGRPLIAICMHAQIKAIFLPRVKWHTELRESCPFVPVLCVANKIDADMSVTDREFTFATSNSIPLFFVSASSGINVVRTFNEAIRQAIQFKLEPKDEAMDELMRLVEEQYN